MADQSLPHLILDPTANEPPTRDNPTHPSALPAAKSVKTHPTKLNSTENASIYFVGTATTILEWEGIRLMTDPNFLHAGDHVHLGPGVTGTRKTNPALDLHELPRIDVVLLSHYHADHFDQEVESSLRRSLPIITTPHAKSHLSEKADGEAFTSVYDLDTFQSMFVDITLGAKDSQANVSQKGPKSAAMKVTAMPGKHVPPGILGTLNDFLGAVPPTNGWMLELGYLPSSNDDSFQCTYRIYISGDTLLVDELKTIPERYAGQNIDLMLIHLGGTSIPGPNAPLLMVTMDAKQGVELLRLINPDLTIPIHYDDYDVFQSPLSDFIKEIEQAGLSEKVVYLDRQDRYSFEVKDYQSSLMIRA
ncbi:Metallo-hydrolase/oxidoreductase [Glarea lozoyensis ATCC 20868]|uniref:Metallo-hydrolase/oxidoreductase n=1 Tax=Glarea lozoyensis (strain ATCC 20868 / MF5171) TaxID=1116229 RepID=S3DEH5_GLAL2|nr:Metallo-hydrolase/oxidoreductase [Glarea lozoyensis ATCC 20868]EPE30366.1 Metallo-hydrolase/oxidoreductase [Glarea lozoyensis ATCC 20868]